MKFGVYTIRRRVSVGLKPDVIKLAVQHPATGEPRLFFVRRNSTVADFEKILKAEFPFVGAFNFYVHDHLGEKTILTPDVRLQTSFYEEMKASELAVDADSVEIGMRYDTSSSELKKRFILDLVENTIRAKLADGKSAVLKTEFNDYLSGSFKRDLKQAIDAAKPEVEKRKQSIGAIIASWEAFRDKFFELSVKKSMKPVKILLLLSIIQFAVLFYLTFFVYDWNVVEPLAYMLTVGLQFGFLAGFALKRKSFGPELFYRRNMKRMVREFDRNVFYAEELYIKRRALENLLILFK